MCEIFFDMNNVRSKIDKFWNTNKVTISYART